MGDSWYASAWHIAAVKTVDAWRLYVSFVSEYNMKQQIQSFHGAIMAVAQLADAPLAALGGAAVSCPPCLGRAVYYRLMAVGITAI